MFAAGGEGGEDGWRWLEVYADPAVYHLSAVMLGGRPGC